jgi:hypothetical protein
MSLKKIGFTALIAVMSALVTVVAYNYIGGKNSAVSFEEKQAAHLASVNYTPPMVNSAGPVDFRATAKITTPAVVHIPPSASSTILSATFLAREILLIHSDKCNPLNPKSLPARV